MRSKKPAASELVISSGHGSLGMVDPNWRTPKLLTPGDAVAWISERRLRELEQAAQPRRTRRRGPAAETLKACELIQRLRRQGRTWREVDQVLSERPHCYSSGTAKRMFRKYARRL